MRIANYPLWTPLAALALAFSWLLPNAQPPWVAFHKDAYLALVLLLVSCAVLVQGLRSRTESRLDILSLYLVGLAALTAVQWAVGTIEFGGKSFLGISYFLAAGLAIYVGRYWTAWSPGHLERFLFYSFVAAGIATAGIVYGQWMQIEMHPVWFNYVAPGERPFGNLNQPNNAGSLLLLGLISMSWLMISGRLRSTVFMLGAVFLIGAIVLTVSRITYLSLSGLLAVAIAVSWLRAEYGVYKWTPVILLLVFLVTFLAQQYGWGEAVESVNPLKRDLTGIRMVAYRAFGDAVWEGSVWGFGFDQTVKAQLLAGDLGHKLPGLFGWTHNFLLDIAVWFGWPIALLGAVLAGWSAYWVICLRLDLNVVASVACIFVLLAHGLVELPLAYAYFLLPLCLLVGALLGRTSIPTLQLSSFVAGGWLIGLVFALAALWADYLRVEAAFNEWRFKAARIGVNPDKIDTDFRVLDQFSVLIDGLDADPSKTISFDLSRFQSAVLLFPSPYALQRLVLFQAKNGNPEAAQKSIEITRLLTTPETNRDMAAQWRVWQNMDPDLAPVQWNTD